MGPSGTRRRARWGPSLVVLVTAGWLAASTGCTRSFGRHLGCRDDLGCFDEMIERLCEEVPVGGPAFGAAGSTYAGLCVGGTDPLLRRVRGAIAGGRLGIDRDALEECLARDGSIALDDALLRSSDCPDVWAPRTPIGAPCDTGLECLDGYCRRDDESRSRPHYIGAGCGVCAPLGDRGARCVGWAGALQCRPGLTCWREVCGPGPAAIGEPCAELGCVPEGRCDEATGRCVARLPLGASCSGSDACESRFCSAGICAPRRPDGAACTDAFECEHGTCRSGICGLTLAHGAPCSDTAACPPSSICDGVCRRYLAVGAPCGPATIDRCVPGADCREGLCVVGSDLGGACESSCLRGVCEAGRCVSAPPGTPCRLGDTGCGALVCSEATDRCTAYTSSCRDTGACADGEYCSDRRGTCAPICILP